MEELIMSKKEREQLIVFEQLKNGEITQLVGAYKLGVTVRWVRKKFKRYLDEGVAGLVHKNRGRDSKKRWNEGEKKLAIDLLKSEWHGFGPTFTAEKLLELHDIKVSRETVRIAMINSGLWNGKKKRSTHRKRRQRRDMLGLMVQLDGSPHDWFEGRAPKCTLLVFIDDATSTILWLEFAESESCQSIMQATKNYIEQHGRPGCFYVDHGSSFHVNLNNKEHLRLSQWERALSELAIEVIHAHSPQAKGRVERANQTMQDRLIKEMRIASISSIKDANIFLRQSDFIAKHNKKFAIAPQQKGDAHRTIDGYNLNSIFCIKETRKLANDNTIQYEKRIFQLDSEQRTIIRPGDEITVSKQLDGQIVLLIRKTLINFIELKTRPAKPEKIYLTPNPRKMHENSRRFGSGLPPIPHKLTQIPQERRVG